MQSQSIKTLKRKYPREWLLIDVDKLDPFTTTPLSGKLVAHSSHREDIYQRLMKRPKAKKLLVEYSQDTFPKGYAAAF